MGNLVGGLIYFYGFVMLVAILIVGYKIESIFKQVRSKRQMKQLIRDVEVYGICMTKNGKRIEPKTIYREN